MCWMEDRKDFKRDNAANLNQNIVFVLEQLRKIDGTKMKSLARCQRCCWLREEKN